MRQNRPFGDRSRVWVVLRTHKADWLSANAIAGEANVATSTAIIYLNALHKAQLVESVSQMDLFLNKRVKVWRLIKDVGIDAPRLNAKGETLPEPLYCVMWRTMKMMRRFTLLELRQHVLMTHEISDIFVRKYVGALQKAGYVREQDGVFVLTKNTGNHAPQILRVREVYDPNLDKTMFRECLNDE